VLDRYGRHRHRPRGTAGHSKLRPCRFHE
jgi:hypothetical protein